ncbi:hypothetical protein DY240_31170 [Jiangella rhizosphaerae]|uniref:Uncharacterized protein n=1 Tax=Jiangella rhizosphaerae TaxID=2293569 RepID=A0A418KGF1_9ACTN|nr:hypothetical protein DY240_31170 [Jiangella rhizosphaerae]
MVAAQVGADASLANRDPCVVAGGKVAEVALGQVRHDSDCAEARIDHEVFFTSKVVDVREVVQHMRARRWHEVAVPVGRRPGHGMQIHMVVDLREYILEEVIAAETGRGRDLFVGQPE